MRLRIFTNEPMVALKKLTKLWFRKLWGEFNAVEAP
jgi:hypothetical protein